ncbi:MAG: ammonium transporter [Candidatus Nanopelagicales bacterium]|nr:ammonium transporter [Candidatus Nanopelagicales bacterium]MDZ4248478.1 ammonium transporter [Candidatus Nanopelagicales bacterium]
MPESVLNSGDTAWILVSAALVMLMLPGLALFYGGMTRVKSSLNMIMMVFGALCVIGIVWILYGYSMTFGTDTGLGLIANPLEFFGLEGLMADDPTATYPVMAFVAFQAMFVAVTAALIAGAIADRAKFGVWLVFAAIWATVVYFPVAHWVWGSGGWMLEGRGPLNGVPVIDFAGGTVVEIASGASALGLAFVLGRRLGWPKTPMRPHNMTLVMLGAGLLWFGWFGFNAGSALSAGNTAAVVFVNTFGATCAAALGWLLLEKIRDGHATSLGAASGIVAGAVAITPSGSAVSPIGALILGAIAGVVCALAVGLKYRFAYDDSFDVVAVHLVGGLIGTLLIGLLATEAAPAGVNGLFYGGGADQLRSQAIAAFVVLFYTLVVTVIIGKLIAVTVGFRVSEDDEISGVDRIIHAEAAYELTESGAGGRFAGVGAAAAARTAQEEA